MDVYDDPVFPIDARVLGLGIPLVGLLFGNELGLSTVIVLSTVLVGTLIVAVGYRTHDIPEYGTFVGWVLDDISDADPTEMTDAELQQEIAKLQAQTSSREPAHPSVVERLERCAAEQERRQQAATESETKDTYMWNS